MKRTIVKFIFLILSAIPLSACDTGSGVTKPKETQYTDMQLDHNQCISNGFGSGTYEYRECRQKLAEQRGEGRSY